MTKSNNQLNKPMGEDWENGFDEFSRQIFFTILGDERYLVDQEDIFTGKKSRVELKREKLNNELRDAYKKYIKNLLSQTKSQIVEQILGELDFYDYGGDIKTIELKEYLIDLKNKQ